MKLHVLSRKESHSHKPGRARLCAALAALSCTLSACASRQGFVPTEEGSVRGSVAESGWLLGDEERRLPLIQNASGAGVAQFTALFASADKAALKVLVVDDKGESVPQKSITLQLNDPFQTRPEWSLAKIRVEGLDAERTYTLRIEKGSEVRDSRLFRVPDTSDGRLTLAYGTCMNDESPYKAPARKLVTRLAAENPDLLIIAGDSVYVDSWERWENEPKGTRPVYDPTKGLNDFELRYIETWTRLPLYRMKRLIPIISVWDDHDYGTNDGDTSFAFKEVSLAAHEAFYGAGGIKGVYEEPFSSAGGKRSRKDQNRASVYHSDGNTFLLADNRTHRVFESNGEWLSEFPGDELVNYAAHFAAHTGTGRLRAERKKDSIFGLAQHQWISKIINQRPKGPLWFISGNQFFGNHHTKETFSSRNPNSLYWLIQELFRSSRPFVILSGDIHYSEVSGYVLGRSPADPSPSAQDSSAKPPKPGPSYDVLELSISPFHSTIKTDTVNSGLLEKNKNPNRLKCDTALPPQCSVDPKKEDSDLGLSGHNFAIIRITKEGTAAQTFQLKLQSLLEQDFSKEALLHFPATVQTRRK